MKLALVAATAIVLAASPLSASALQSPRASGVPSDAQIVRLHDARGDTWSYSDTSDYVPAPQPAADVLRATITHTRYAVGVRMVFDDLRRTGTQWYRIEIHTPGDTSWFIVEARRNHHAGTTYQDVDGEWVRVPGPSHSIDYAADVMTLRVPRTLLGDPPWVRVRLHDELRAPDGTIFTDNPMNEGTDAAFTPRIPSPALVPRGPLS